MKKTLASLVSLFVAFGCSQLNDQDGGAKELPRIAIAGFAIESSTFSPAFTHEEAFHARVADDVFTFYPFLSPDSLNRKRANWIPTIRGHALPGCILTNHAYESLVMNTIDMLSKKGK